MQGTYFTSQYLEEEGGGLIINVRYKNVMMTKHTHKPRIAHKTKPSV